MLYRTLRTLAALALRWFYRSIEVRGVEHLPTRGATLLAANHPNAMIDALVIGTAVARPVRLTAKATLLKNPFTRVVVRALGIVPLARAADSSSTDAARAHLNAGAFDAVVETLRAGGLVLIFPEGRSHSEPSLGDLKTGCARMALQARQQGVTPLVIVPAGLTFEKKDQPRSRVVLQFGPPIHVDDTRGTDPDAVAALTDTINVQLRALTLNFASADDAARILELSRSLAAVLGEVRSVEDPHAPLSETVAIAQRLEVVRQNLPNASPELAQRVEQCQARIAKLRSRLAQLRVPLSELWIDTSAQAGAGFALREIAIGLALGPLALWGRVNHWVPVRVALAAGRGISRNQDEPAMNTIVIGLATVLAMYAGIAALVSSAFDWRWGMAYLASLPPAASIDFWLADRWRRVAARARSYLVYRRHPSTQRELIALAASLRAEVARLNEELGS